MTAYTMQAIYYPADFTGMPAGRLKNFYFRSGLNFGSPSFKYTDFRIKMKYTSLTRFPNGSSIQPYTSKDTLIPTNQGDDVANYPSFLMVGAQQGDWIKVPLNVQLFNSA